LDEAASDSEVVVRTYPTDDHGTFLAIVNTSMRPKTGVVISLPEPGLAATDRVTMSPLTIDNDSLTIDLKVAGVLVVQLLPQESADPGDQTPDEASCGSCSSGGVRSAGFIGLLLTLLTVLTRRVCPTPARDRV
jgi:hypothetical protein